MKNLFSKKKKNWKDIFYSFFIKEYHSIFDLQPLRLCQISIFYNEHRPVIITEYSSNGSLDKIIALERQSLSPPLWDDTKKLINIYGLHQRWHTSIHTISFIEI